jgi:hypothetical protein
VPQVLLCRLVVAIEFDSALERAQRIGRAICREIGEAEMIPHLRGVGNAFYCFLEGVDRGVRIALVEGPRAVAVEQSTLERVAADRHDSQREHAREPESLAAGRSAGHVTFLPGAPRTGKRMLAPSVRAW